MSNNSPQSRRAALRARQEAELKVKRRKKLIIAFSGVFVASIVIITAVSLLFAYSNKSKNDVAQISPPNATKDFGILFKSDKLKPNAPKVVIYQDFQCPACKDSHERYDKSFTELAKNGDISLEYRTLNFLGPMLRNNASMRAGSAAIAADIVGMFSQYQNAVFSHQPEKEGDGYSDDLLRNKIPKEIGMSGSKLAKFQKIYDEKSTEKYILDATDNAQKHNITATPTYLVNGKDLFNDNKITPSKEIDNPESLLEFIKNTVASK